MDAARIPAVSGNRPSAAWGLVRQFLLDAALAAAGIEFIESVTVTGVRDHDRAGPVTVDSTEGAFTAVVVDGVDGVDGVYPPVRRTRPADGGLRRIHAVARPGR